MREERGRYGVCEDICLKIKEKVRREDMEGIKQP